MFWLLIGSGLICFGQAFVNWRHQIGPVAETSKTYALIGVLVAAGLMLAPKLTGVKFTLFQGNYIDAFRYLESVITYAN